MVTDGQRIVACRYGTAGDGDSDAELGATLYLSRSGQPSIGYGAELFST